MHPKSPFRSIVAPTHELSDRQYALRMIVVPCWYFPSPSPLFQPISPSPPSHISSVAVPHLLCHCIHPCCPASPSPFSSAAVFTADLVCHPHYPISPPCLHCHPPASLLCSSSHYLPLFRVLRRLCLSTFSDRIFSFIYVVLYYTVCSALLHTNFLTLRSDLITTLFFSILARLFSISVIFSLCYDLPRFSPLDFTPLCSNLTITLISVCSYLLAPSLICSTMIAPLMLWFTCSDLLG